MAFTLESVVPWGRSLDEYTRMFALTPAEIAGTLLDCGGGPSSFNAEMRERGGHVVSCDPLYRFTTGQIARRIDEIYPTMVAGAEATRDRFVWTEFETPAGLAEARMRAMRRFLDDFETGRAEGRYVLAALPHLPFRDAAFDLALCSHLLFTYSDHFATDFHVAAITEMCRVAAEARIFPLLNQFSGEPSPHLAPVLAQLQARGYTAEVVSVDYEFQRGGNRMLSVRLLSNGLDAP